MGGAAVLVAAGTPEMGVPVPAIESPPESPQPVRVSARVPRIERTHRRKMCRTGILIPLLGGMSGICG